MSNENPKSLPAIGFLTIVEHAGVGLCGGYLLLNQHGRPLEFHCTAPVKANRAQEILYGPTLTPYLYGEQIGQTLVSAALQQPLVVCTDVDQALALREFVSVPVVLVGDSDQQQSVAQTKDYRIDEAHGANAPSSQLVRFMVENHSLAVPTERETDRIPAIEQLNKFAEAIDLSEPFGRIHEAIEEALRGAK